VGLHKLYCQIFLRRVEIRRRKEAYDVALVLAFVEVEDFFVGVFEGFTFTLFGEGAG
jgi:hypothetical protein